MRTAGDRVTRARKYQSVDRLRSLLVGYLEGICSVYLVTASRSFSVGPHMEIGGPNQFQLLASWH
jgi:hypothetical protein